ncbi:hypothetical protein F5Y13DRAFT_29005 [Hypoxylon sp. FL1857]|nr:hypothetical protein F5Y13DRAFT_29005 [Hypoxylon sp. FL1857]
MMTAPETTTMAERLSVRACLDNLPVEMLDDILSSLHSPLELNSIIHASSVCYRVFTRSRTRLLTRKFWATEYHLFRENVSKYVRYDATLPVHLRESGPLFSQ